LLKETKKSIKSKRRKNVENYVRRQEKRFDEVLGRGTFTTQPEGRKRRDEAGAGCRKERRKKQGYYQA